MHFEILIEDQSGKKMLSWLVPAIIGNTHTFNIHSYKGVGRIPRDLRGAPDPANRVLLNQLPRLLNGYGVTFSQYPSDYPACVVIICDLDNRCLKQFREELLSVLKNCTTAPDANFCIAVQEGEAWLLGDMEAVRAAYPKASREKIKNYADENIQGTWEHLADILYNGGASALKKQGWSAIGREKSLWAEKIAPLVGIYRNRSHSFGYFRDKLHELSNGKTKEPKP